jgi:hypothetical protein
MPTFACIPIHETTWLIVSETHFLPSRASVHIYPSTQSPIHPPTHPQPPPPATHSTFSPPPPPPPLLAPPLPPPLTHTRTLAHTQPPTHTSPHCATPRYCEGDKWFMSGSRGAFDMPIWQIDVDPDDPTTDPNMPPSTDGCVERHFFDFVLETTLACITLARGAARIVRHIGGAIVDVVSWWWWWLWSWWWCP